MPYLILQVAALMLAAYFLGAMTGCLLRRLFYVPAPRADAQSSDWAQAGMAPAVATAAAGAPMIQVGRETAALGTASASSRFERALSQAPETAPQLETIEPMEPAPPPPPLDLPPEVEAAPEPAIEPAPAKSATPAPSAIRDEADVEIVAAKEDPLVFDDTSNQASAATEDATDSNNDTSYRQSATAAAAAAAATVGAGYVLGRMQSTTEPTPAAEDDESVAPAAVPQDLTRIQFIDTAMATELNNRGITRFEDLAEMDLDALNAIEAELGIVGRPDRERWVAQAGRLARGEATDDIVATIPQTSVLPNDLTQISSIDAALASRLNNRGITRFDDLANMHPDDVAELDDDLGLEGQIAREQWTTQAYRLSRGQPTDDVLAAAPTAPMSTGSVPAVTAASPATAPDITAEAASTDSDSDDAPAERPTRTNVDQAAIAATGMAAATAAATRASGTGNWSDREPRDPTARRPASTEPAGPTAAPPPPPPPATNPIDLDAPPRPAKLGEAIKDNTGQVSGFRETAPSAPDVSTISTLRSVRSEALAGRAKRDGAGDDLKRIRGIGVLIEKKLNSLGITTYEQIANWTNDDVDHFSSKLDFKGRIEREHWIEQARILTSGG